MTLLLNVSTPFASRGVHPTVGGPSIDFSPAQQTAMGSVDGNASTTGFNGTTNAGVIEWRQSSGASLSIPGGEVLTILTAEMVARVASPVTYTTDPVWGVELFDSRTGATIGAVGKQAAVPLSSSLQVCTAGGVDTWGATQAKLLDVLSAGALRIRWTSPGWTSDSTGSLIIDGARLTVQSGPPPASKRQQIITRRTAAYGRVPQPSELVAGELAVNLAEGRLYVGAGAYTMGINAVPFWWQNGQYFAGYVTMFGNRLWVANKTTGPGPRVTADWNEYHAATAQTSNLFNGLTMSLVYDIMHPFNMPMLWRGTQADLTGYNNGLASSGIAARWWIADGLAGRPNSLDRLVRGASADGELNQLAGSWDGFTGLGGAHGHGGSVGFHTLSLAEIPSHTHTYRRTTGSGGQEASGSVGSPFDSETNPAGGSQGHNHPLTIDNAGDHQHYYTRDVTRISWYYIVRTA